VDIDGHASEPKVVEAIEALTKHCTFVKVLGTYPKTLS
jgi:prephenate dehydratase